MKLFWKSFFIMQIMFFFSQTLWADRLEELLKQDFTAQQTIQIKFFVNKRLYAFEGHKPKLAEIEKDKARVWEITGKIVPWAIFEGLKPDEVARIIVYMFHAEKAGAAFLDSEDLIPLVASKNIPLTDFIFMVQYNREVKRAQIPEPIRQLFLTSAVEKGWDGPSILAGGRALLLAKSSGMDLNKAASLLLKKIPAKGSKVSSQQMISIVKKAINFRPETQNLLQAEKLLENLADLQKLVQTTPDSPAQLKNIVETTQKLDNQTQKISQIEKPKVPVTTNEIKKEKGLIPDLDTKPGKLLKKDWKTLDLSILMKVIQGWLGTPYRYGGKDRGGIDCSGFTRIVMIDQRIGVPTDEIGHGTVGQKQIGSTVAKGNLRAGDLVFFSASPNASKITHVGIVTSNKTFSHSCNAGVIHDELTKKHWSQRYVLSRRIFANVIK
jgi:cell wall-associated NlpC family hydrolase